MVAILKLLALATSAAAAAILPRNIATFARAQSGIDTINAGLSQLKGHLDHYRPSLIVNDIRALGRDLETAIKDVDAGEAVNDTVAIAIIFYVQNSMEPELKKTIKALKNRKAQLTVAKKRKNVETALKQLKQSVVKLGQSLLAKAPEGKRKEGKKVMDKVVADVEDAVKHFSR